MTTTTTPGSEGEPVVQMFADALRGDRCHVVRVDDVSRLPVEDWQGLADHSDRMLLDHCVGRTLDIGSGPGRMSEHLMLRGQDVLAIDVVDEAVSQTRARGVNARLQDVFSPVPDEGRWDTALLADGNIGIGGDPVTLLRRVHELLAPAGRVVVDLDPPGTGLLTHWAVLRSASADSHPFRWAAVGVDAIETLADAAGFFVAGTHREHDRWFAVLARRS
ncbi:MAG: methyltransferase domain-containing protein [Nocardioides sp.]